jgi:hypothetical protein
MRNVAFLGALITLSMTAQPSRDAYRNAYKAWRQADANLEQDAGAGGAAPAQRAGQAATEAAKYGVERSAFLLDLADEQGQKLAWLENAAAAETPPDFTAPLREFVSAESAAVGRNIDTFASDPDKGIQQLRQALQRERAALASLSAAVTEQQKAAKAAGDAGAAAETARIKTVSQYKDLVAGLKQASEQVDREAGEWQDYYRKLAENVRGIASETPAAGSIVAPPMRSLMPSITPVPLPRYVGEWTFPGPNGLYHGPQPEFLDLVVHEEKGHAEGTVVARFKLPPGSTENPVVRFDFSGDFKNVRKQVFNLTTSDGAKGTIELIPGPAFNLIEVNFQTEPRPGRVRQGNVVLVKK